MGEQGTMTSRSTKNSNCVVCCAPVFPFERKVKVADLDQHEKAACASVLRTQDQDSGGILCVSCYRKLQQGTEDCDSGNQTQGGSTQRDSAQTAPLPPPHDNLQISEAPNPNSSAVSPRFNSTKPEQDPQPSAEAASVLERERAQQNPQLSAAAVPERERAQQNPQLSAAAVTERGRAQKNLAEAVTVAGREREVSSNNRASTPEEAKMNDRRATTWSGVLRICPLPSWVKQGSLAVVAGTVVGLGLGGSLAVSLAGIAVLLGIVIVCVKLWDLIRPWFPAMRAGQNVTRMVASAIDAGSSLAGTSLLALMQDGYSVTCGIEVENWTRFSLVQPQVQLGCGLLSLAPSSIAPASKEAMVARKPSGRAEGSYGTVSWLIQPMNRRLVVMWSAPYNFDFYSNWLAVGLTAVGTTEHAPGKSWFEQMYKHSSTQELTFERGEYYTNIRPVVCRVDGLEVEGIMGSDHKAVVKVTLRPVHPNNFAPSIKKKMKAA